MQNFFMPNIKRLAEIDKMPAVDLLRRLLHLLGARAGLTPQEISVSSKGDVADGGVDGWVQTNRPIDFKMSLDLFYSGTNAYQVKTGNFSATRKKDRRSLVFKNSAEPKYKSEGLHPGVKKCLDMNGTLICFLPSDDNPNVREVDPVEELLKELALVDSKYKKAKIKILRANQVAHMLSHFYGLVLDLEKKTGPVYRLSYIMERCGLESGEYMRTPLVDSLIQQIHDVINKVSGFQHVRIVGEPGIGKTRFVYEAVNSSNYTDSCIYAPGADALLISTSVLDSIYDDSNYLIILIVDECDAHNKAKLHQLFQNIKKPMVLITIHNELEGDEEGNPDYLFLQPPVLTLEKVAEILQSYGVIASDAAHIAKYCSGSPRVAHIVGKHLKIDPKLASVLRMRGIEKVWDLYLYDGNDSAEEKRVKELVITNLALFKKFGWGPEVNEEAVYILEKIINKVDPSLTKDKYRSIIEHYKKRKILQGSSTLYISPKLLHIKLWSDWWEKYSGFFNLPDLLGSLNDGHLYTWFADMVIYVRGSKLAKQHFERLLQVGGFFDDLPGFNDDGGGILFRKLAQILPKAAVRAVSRALEQYSAVELKSFKKGRRTLVHSLEHIALHGDCFDEAADCLLKLAVAENEKWSNNATGVFTDLFSLGYGDIAPTELSPEERLPLLLSYLKSSDSDVQILAIDAFGNALRTSVTRTIIRNSDPLYPDPKGWKPETYGDLSAVYELYLKALWNACSASLSGAVKDKAAAVLLRHARTFLSTKQEVFINIVLEILRSLSKENKQIVTQVIEEIVTILRYDSSGMDQVIEAELRQIHDDLSGSSLKARLERYVGMNLLEDRYESSGEPSEKMNTILADLAADCIKDLPLFEKELSWLVTREAENGYEFGKVLGGMPEREALWPKIKSKWLEQGDEASDYFIGGFLLGVFELNATQWEVFVRQISDTALASQLPSIVLRSGMTDSIAEFLLVCAEKNIIHSYDFGMFIFGGAVKKIPPYIIKKMLALMVERGDRKNILNALEIVGSLLYNKIIPEVVNDEITFKILSHPVFFNKTTDVAIHTMQEHAWKEVAIALAKADIAMAIKIFGMCLQHLGEEGTIIGGYKSDAWDFLDYVTQASPKKAWIKIAENIDPLGMNGMSIMQWLGEPFTSHKDENTYAAFNALPYEEIFKWIDEDVKRRAVIMGQFAPFELKVSDSIPKSFIREILERYGKDIKVRQAVSANYATESWVGTTSSHFKNKLKSLTELKDTEKNSNVLRWLSEEIGYLEDAINKAEIREERDEG